MKLNSTLYYICAGLLALLSSASASYSATPAISDTTVTVYLQSIPTILAPEIQDNKVKYTVHFVFDTCPAENWAYYNTQNKQLIIDFYGIHIIESPQVVLKGAPALKKMEIKNSRSTMSLNGLRAQIVLSLDSHWNYELTQISGKVLRLNIWKHLDPAATFKKERHKGSVVALVTLISSSTAAVTVLILLLLNKSG